MTSFKKNISELDDFPSWSATKQADYIAYHLTSNNIKGITGKDISLVLESLDLREYKRINSYLSENASASNGKYIKVKKGGYRLTLLEFKKIEKKIKKEPTIIAVSTQLEKLVLKISDNSEQIFIEEAINCYKIKSYRAFIIMIWIVTMDHLQKFIFSNNLNDFNIALSKKPTKKMRKIINYDDFSDLQENKIIELARSAKIISNDVRKILEEKLGVRNSSAHPSGIKISGHKATEFALDLLSNVLTKYK